MNPLVSIVMPVYNGSAHIAEGVDAIIAQRYDPWELIIVDDGSTDGTGARADRYRDADPRIRVVHIAHGGPGYAMNAGVRHAQGEWIARADHDDVFPPDRLDVQVPWADEHALEICGGQVEVFGDDAPAWWFPESAEGIRNELIFRPSIMPSTMIMRAHVAHDNPYDETAAWDDYEFLTRACLRYRVASMARVLVRYRRHDHQTSRRLRARFLADLRRYRLRYVYERFPGTPPAMYLALARISDELPVRDLAEMERSAAWLERLSEPSEPASRTRMARRWTETWERSWDRLPPGAADLFARTLDRLTEGARA